MPFTGEPASVLPISCLAVVTVAVLALVVAGWPCALGSALRDLLRLYRAWWHYWVCRGAYSTCPEKFQGSLHAQCHAFSLALDALIYRQPHYRNPSYRDDLLANLRNVAVPGTGLPLSIIARSRLIGLPYLIFAYPVLCAVAAFHHAWRLDSTGRAAGLGLAARWARAFRTQLLEPQDWFSFWRMNSRVAAWHSAVTKDWWGGGYHDYKMENKWDFLERGKELGVPVSPILDLKAICVKHKNEEGGMGIHFFRNATEGGDWIIQGYMSNDAFVASLLPERAPLSTFRVMTASWGGLDSKESKAGADVRVEVLSSVFRAGRKGAATDHSAVMFDVDAATGDIKRGTRNAQWYVLGPKAWCGTPWGPPRDEHVHPDSGTSIAGAKVPDWEKIREIVIRAHRLMLPRVPLCGWDVCLTAEHGVCLLEANLSCNFFRGSFNQPEYFKFIDAYHRFCERAERPS